MARGSPGLSIAPAVMVAAMAIGLPTSLVAQSGDAGWYQWGGPNRDFVVEATGLADRWPDDGPPVLWSRPLGVGHSAIVEGDGRLFTMYRVGDGRNREGPWDLEETVVALDAATGETLWEHTYPSALADFNFGAGPHSTPLLADGRLFTVGTYKQFYAFDAATGDILWSHDLVAEFGAPRLLLRPVVRSGYGCSPIAYRDLVICSVGGPGQSVMAFRQADGAVVWRSGHFLTSQAPPILINVDGQDQLVFFAGQSVNGLDPASGHVLWSHVHDAGNDLNLSHPLWGDDNILFVSSAYIAGSRALKLLREDDITRVEELWFNSRLRFMFLNGIRLGDHVYGTSGDFGPAFLTAIHVPSGEVAWRTRGFSRASLLYADDKLILMDEDGDLALARITPEGMTVLSRATIFETTAWTAPTLVGTTLYARDREKIVAIDLGDGTAAPVASPPTDLSGTWQLDVDASRIAGPLLRGGGDGGPADALHITQAANGTLVVGNLVNAGQAWSYRPDGETTVPVGVNAGLEVTSRWDGQRFIAEGALPLGTDGPVTQLREVMALADGGAVLTIAVTATTADGEITNHLVYRRSGS
ncbi:MAG: PQQ-like beta-propeller repeat protein [Vicinamibacterales bacterium]|jgi:hypothetical protein|nr:PQQ-like beta-propeller repeat protein [Vicinamibacterales bacterium]MDP6609809.1 PQQ-like beta-propeller repeat protein [Vicinamibacterales bacterium]HAK55956.1 hypothetical protein [Acidobacteriota bacterium]|tara:strand:+ start:896 stop:2650 length:1755 start_codon:yes stop_codon:yes gene_type:complete